MIFRAMKKLIPAIALAAACLALPAARGAAYDGVPPETLQNGAAVIDVYAGPTSRVPGSRRVRFASSDKSLAEQLWREYAPIFGEGDWNNADPYLRHEVIIIAKEGRRMVLSSRHRIAEPYTDIVFTARGIETLGGRTREEVLRAGPPEYLARREAFDRLIEEFDRLKKESPDLPAAAPQEQPGTQENQPQAAAAPADAGAPSFQTGADYSARVQAQREQLRSHERRRTLKRFTSRLQLLPIVLPFSIPWFVPLLLVRKAARRAGLTSPWWLLPALALSPLGLAYAVSVTYVTKGMVVLSILAPAACALLLRAFPRAADAPQSKWPEWTLTGALLLYGSWSAMGAQEWHAATSIAGSNEKAALGQLSYLRSALQVYYGDKEGKEFPAGLHELIPRYMDGIPRVNSIARDTILHESSDRVEYFSGKAGADDKGGWGYVNEPTLPDGRPNPEYGAAFINCTHMDLRGTTRLCDY